MALIRCPECKKEISNTAKKCQYCGCNIKAVIKRAEQERKHKEAQEAWEKASPKEKAVTSIIGCIIIVFVLIFLFNFCGSTYDSNDSKCDICDKKAYSTIKGDGGEYCYEHYKWAIDYYLND